MGILAPIVLALVSYEIAEHLLHILISRFRYLHIFIDASLGTIVAGTLAWYLIIRRTSVSLTKNLSVFGRHTDQRIDWFINLRWLAIIGTFTVVFVSTHVLKLLPAEVYVPLWGGTGILMVMNFVFILMKRRVQNIRSFFLLQIAVDIVLLTFLLHFSGGIENPFVIMYVFNVIVACVLLSRSDAYLVTAVVIAFFLFMALGEYFQILNHHFSIFLPPSEGHMSTHFPFVLGISGSLIAISLGVAYYITGMMEQLRENQTYLLQSERLATLGQLVAYIVHEVNNPMGIISTRTKLLKSKIKTQSDPFLIESMEIIDRQSERVGQIVRNLLGFSRLNPSTESAVDVKQVLVETLDIVKSRIERVRIDLKCSFSSSLPLIQANRNNLIQIFLNLIMNAIDAMPQGGRLKLSAESVDGWVEIAVSDSGSGIPEENMEKIFDPFFTTKLPEYGTGLGLPLCVSLVKSMKGEINVKSVAGRGASFCVRLPSREAGV